MKASNARTASVGKRILLSLLIAFGTFQSAASASGANTTLEPIRIASFNIQILGQKKAGKADVMRVLSEIVRTYDIVAVQDQGQGRRSTRPNVHVEMVDDDGEGETAGTPAPP